MAVMGGKDTLKSDYFTGGKIDSIDIAFANHSSTMPAGGFSTSENVLPYNFFILNKGSVLFRNFSNWKKMQFSALPHLGFGYIFGGQATQIVNTSYTQAFNQQTLLNVDYNMNRGNNFLRSGEFNNHDVQLQFQFQSKFYSLDLKSQYLNMNIGQNGGVQSDSLIDYYGLAFAPINKENAESKIRATRTQIDHYFDFLPKDSINAIGLYIHNTLQIYNRKYFETSSFLDTIYGSTNINNSITADQYQLSELKNAAGLYYAREKIYLKVGMMYNWWNYFNLGTHIAKSEVNLDAQLGLDFKSLNLQNHSNVNFIGASGEWFSNTKLRFNWKDFKFNANANFSNQLPEQFQRNYFGNNIYYSTPFDQLNKLFAMDLQAKIAYQYKLHGVGIFVNNATLSNNYWFYNNQWVADTMNVLNALSTGIEGRTGYKALHFTFKGSYNVSNWMPKILVQSRLYLQGRIFKGKKLLAQIGVEGSYHDGYQLMEHLPYMDVMRFTTINNSSMANLHVFGAFQLARFRFFFRVENIGYFWNNSANRIALNQPISAMQIRLGITWDFFN